jgi:uncharacterized protein YbjT (DUF2867 family)
MTGNGDLVTIFGGAGFVGRHTVSALAKRGYTVRAAVRRPDLAGHLQPMGAVGQIHAVQANLRYPDSVRRAVEGAQAVINTVAVLAPSGKQTFEALHVDGARAVAKAAREAGAQRFIHISSIGADVRSASNYARTKAAGEQAVLAEFPNAIIFRPSIIFGPEDQFFNRFAEMARMSPFLPLIGGGRNKMQPVYVGDVAEAIAAAVDGKGEGGKIYEIGGPETLSFRELMDRTQFYSGRNRSYLYLPFWLAKLQAALMSPLPNSLRPITVDQVRSLQTDNVVSEAARNEGRTLASFGITSPTAIASVVPLYLERFNPRGQYAHYRNS